MNRTSSRKRKSKKRRGKTNAKKRTSQISAKMLWRSRARMCTHLCFRTSMFKSLVISTSKGERLKRPNFLLFSKGEKMTKVKCEYTYEEMIPNEKMMTTYKPKRSYCKFRGEDGYCTKEEIIIQNGAVYETNAEPICQSEESVRDKT